MSLKGLHVLVDGYNLELPQGTGVKTYGVSLITALRRLEAGVSVLFSRRSRSVRGNPVLNEVLFFDGEAREHRLANLARSVRALSFLLYRARHVPSHDGIVIPDEPLHNSLRGADIFNLPDCYRIAHACDKTFRLPTTISLPRKVDVWHATYPLPIRIRGAKKITTIHDLVPLRLPYTTLDDKRSFYAIVRRSIRESAVIVTVSESSKRDILRVFDVDPEKVCVTYQTPALQPLLREESEVAKALRKYGLEYKRYLLFAGAIEPKKNVGRLIDAYVGVDTDMPLVLAGKKGWLWERELKTLRSSAGRKARQRIIILEHVPRPDLAMLYQGAVCFVFPSLYEGFGLPPLEAMGFDCPVLTSETASLPETCGDAAVYVDPYDVHDIRHGLEELLGNPVLQAKLVEKGRRRVEFFRIENYMERLRAAYAKVI